MTCADARPLLSRRRDSALPPGDEAALTAHLATCPDCVRWSAWLERASRAAAAALAVEMSPELSAEALEFAQHLVATRK